MGMACAFHSVSDANLDRILADPPLIWRLIAKDDPDIYIDTVRERRSVGFLGRLFGKDKGSESIVVQDLGLSDEECLECDVDKSWQGIHFCLNGTALEAEPPMDFMTIGGMTVGDVEVGYGPARAYRSGDVLRISERISQIGREQLRENYDPKRMDELDIYPNIWERDGEEGFEYIAEWYEEMKNFIASCAERRLGMVIYLC